MALLVIIVIAVGLSAGALRCATSRTARNAFHDDLLKDPVGLPAGLLSCILLVAAAIGIFVHPFGSIHLPLGQAHLDLWQACLAGSIVSLVIAVRAKPKR